MVSPRRAALVLAAAFCANIACANPPTVGEPAPPYELTALDGTRLDSAGLKGQVVLINIWATWCAPCRKEMPLLDAYARAQGKHGFRVIAVTTEDSLPPYRLKAVADALPGITFARRFRGPYGSVRAVPTSYLIDRAGTVRYAKAASLELDDLNELIVSLLAEPAPAVP
ncbi:TlpA family protein disulfide reductase [Sandaracinobacteroides saxicola]|uniref:TlpA family protein disulfide reductase n=1 Tax=Sandaracinobacteroides saxicola TaxID=2759707 RepID=A0A7G5IF74_9SPHN|nr:TlpA disulfide reductase family protein [Sandaracinobacteroides saxicola]QMW22016.1 TlpA family protein disulfide reductase [Sandaracinobacteroides saxicola]